MYSTDCLRQTVVIWFKLGSDVTWKTLEAALTNVNRAKLGLDPVNDVYSKHVYVLGV